MRPIGVFELGHSVPLSPQSELPDHAQLFPVPQQSGHLKTLAAFQIVPYFLCKCTTQGLMISTPSLVHYMYCAKLSGALFCVQISLLINLFDKLGVI